MIPALRFQLLEGQDPFSAGIEYFTFGSYSHVDAVADDGRLYGARNDHTGGAPSGVEFRDPTYPGSTPRTVITVPCTQVEHDAFWTFLLAQEHKPYDWRAIVSFVIPRGSWRDPGAWICSELQAAATEASGMIGKLCKATQRISPNAWALVLSAIPGRTIDEYA